MKRLLFVLVAVLGIGSAGWGQTVEQARELHQRGYALLDSGDYVGGREFTRQAMEMRRVLLGKVHPDYITSLNNYALSFSMEKDWQQAAKLQQQVMELCDKLPSPHPNLGMYSTNMGRYYYMLQDYADAVKAWERALPLVEKHGKAYEFLLNGLGLAYDELGDKANLERIMGLQQEHNEHELTKPCDEPQCMLERAQYYQSTGNNDMAREHYLKLMAMPMDDAMTASAHEAYSKFLMSLKDYTGATEYALSAAYALKRSQGEDQEYAQMMYHAAVYAFLAGEYKKAIECYQAVIDYYSGHDTPEARTNITMSRKGMGNAYSGLKDFASAKGCFMQVVDYYQSTDPASDEYPKAVLSLAKAEKFNKEYDASIQHHEQAIKLMEERGMNEQLTDAYSSLQLCYAYAGRPMPDINYTAADNAREARLRQIIDDEKSSLGMVSKYLGGLYHARSLASIAGSYAMLQEYTPAVDYYKQYISTVRDAIRDEFRLQSEAQRMATWQDEAASIHELQELMVMLPVGQEELMNELAGVVYDAELLSKGILLNSSIEFEKVLADKGDAQLKAAYEQSKANTDRIAELRQSAATEAELQQILELTRDNQALQQQLYRGCAELADFTDYISHDWHDVQRQLDKNDVAIEFAAIKTGVIDQDNYMAALVLTADMAAPVALPVCNLAIARAMESHEGLFELGGNPVWGALSQYLQGKRRIYFSADGSFNRIGIEYLLYDGKPLSEQYEVYRLSSTKELCYKRHAAPIKRVTLMGHIDYYDGNDLIDINESAYLEQARGRHGLADLEGTLQEVNEIDAVLRELRAASIDMLTGPEASHAAFRALNGSHVNVLHIATHGLFNDQHGASDAQSMENCFLALAGANVSDDGFITAAEVARMNLRDCDLAVLSACETALGKLGGDGVFGLQRGFKNAGVHTLLMSLKQVNDKSTALLMAAFYRLMVTGKCTKREALVRAQQQLRAQGYTDARHWASFIMLDALD